MQRRQSPSGGHALQICQLWRGRRSLRGNGGGMGRGRSPLNCSSERRMAHKAACPRALIIDSEERLGVIVDKQRAVQESTIHTKRIRHSSAQSMSIFRASMTKCVLSQTSLS